MIRSILLLSFLVLLSTSCGQPDAGQWVVVTKDTLIIGVEVTGSLNATKSVSIGPPQLENVWEFKVAALAPEGEVVKEGDMLVVFDTSDLSDRRRSRGNDLETAEVALQKQQVEIKLGRQDSGLRLVEAEAAVRKATLAADQSEELTGSLALAKAKVDLAGANETVEYLRASQQLKNVSDRGSLGSLSTRLKLTTQDVSQLDANIASMTITAESGGTVIYGDNWGDKTKVGETLWRLATAVEVASLDSMMGEGIVDEADFAKLKVGQSVHLRLESQPDQEITGVLTEIGATMHAKSRAIPTQVVSVKLSIKSSGDLKLRPGMRFRGDVETERVEAAAIVPLAAVFPSPGGPIAFVETSDGVARRKLVLGKRGKRGVEVLEGLQPGDRVSRVDLSLRNSGDSQ